MAERIYAFRIDIEGRGAVATEIEQVDKKLQHLSKTRKKINELAKKGTITRQREVEMLKNVRLRTTELQQTKVQLANTDRNLAKQTLTVKGSMAELRLQTSQLVKEANRLNLTTKQGRAEFQKMAAQIDKNKTKIRDFDRSISGSKTLVGEYQRGIVGSFKAIATGIFAAVAAMRVFSTFISGSINSFASYEQGLSNVLTLLDDYTPAFEAAFGAQARKTAIEYGFAIEDVNKSLFDAVSAGVPAAESIGFIDKAAILATAGVTDLGVAVDGITSVINAYGLSMDEANQVASAFFTAQKFGKTTVAELSANIGQVAPIANQLKVSYQELLTTYAELTKQGIKTDLATTGIKATLTALANPSREAAKEFHRLGIETGVVAIQNNGLLGTLVQVAQAVETDGDKLTELIPNVRALTAVGALGSRQLEEYAEILETVNTDYGEGSSIMKAYEKQMQSTSKQAQQLRAQLKEKRIEIGEKLAPVVGFLNNNLEALIRYIKAGTAATIAYIVATKAKVVADKAATIATKAWAVAQAILNKTFQLNPITAIAAGVAALAAGIALLVTRTREQNKVQEENNRINDEADARMQSVQQEYAKQRATVESLVRVIENENAANSEREQAIDALKKIMPEYNAQLTTEGELLQHNKDLITEYLEALKSTIALKSFKAGIEELTAENIILEDQIDRREHVIQLLKDQAIQERKSGQSEAAKNTTGAYKALELELEDIRKQYSLNQVGISNYLLRIKELREELGRTFGEEGTGGETDEQRKAREKELADYIKSISADTLKFRSQSADELRAMEAATARQRIQIMQQEADAIKNQYTATTDEKIAQAEALTAKLTEIRNAQYAAEQAEQAQQQEELRLQALTYADALAELQHRLAGGDITQAFYDQQAAILQQSIDNTIAAQVEADTQVVNAAVQLENDLTTIKQQGVNARVTIDKEGRDRIIEGAQQVLQVASNAAKAFTQILSAQKEKELSAVGDNAARREAIERKYYTKEQNMAATMAIINGLLAFTKELAKGGLLGLITGGLALTAGIAQAVAIKSQKFAEGGVVQSGNEIAGMPRTGDNTLALVKAGEVVLNDSQQAALGGAATFRELGIKGFADGGVPSPSTSQLDTGVIGRQVSAAMQSLKVILNVNELNEANGDLTVINETAQL